MAEISGARFDRRVRKAPLAGLLIGFFALFG
jgi:hypothetical protein